jgi:transposase
MVLRANIILLSSENGVKNKDIARSLGISARVVGKWQQRYLTSGINGLRDEYRSGRPSKLTVMQRAEIIAIACDFPRNYGNDTHEVWTIKELTKTVNKEVEGVSTSTASVFRTLNRNDLKPHKTQAWLHSKDPEFKEKTNEIVDLYINPPEGSAVICVDEKPMQATEHKHDMKPSVPGNAAKVEYEYIRHGTQALIAGFNIENGHVTAQCGDTRKSTDLIDFMEGIAVAYAGYDKIHIYAIACIMGQSGGGILLYIAAPGVEIRQL